MKAFNSLRHCSLAIAIAFVALVFTSCEKGAETASLVDNVPPSAVLVQRWDLEAVLANAGASVENGRVNLPPELLRAADIASPRLLETLLNMPQVVRLDEVVVYITDRGSQVMSFLLKDPDGFAAMVEKETGSKPTKRSGFQVYDLNGLSLLARGDKAWLCEKADAVIKAVDDAKGKRFGEEIGVYEFLTTSDGAMCMAANCSDLGLPIWQDGYVCLNVRLNGPALSGDVSVIDSDGRRVSVDNLVGAVDPDFLRYVPETSVVVAAVGNFANKSLLQSLVPPHYGWLSDYIAKIDGTTSFFAAPASAASGLADFDYENWNMQALIHMPQADVDGAVDMLSQQARKVGMSVKADDGQYTFSEEGIDFYFGNFDGYFGISTNRRISSTYNNPFTEDFSGKRAAVVVEIPYGSEVMKAYRLPYGISFRAGLETDRLTFRLRFNGTDASFIQALINVLQSDARF